MCIGNLRFRRWYEDLKEMLIADHSGEDSVCIVISSSVTLLRFQQIRAVSITHNNSTWLACGISICGEGQESALLMLG
jgi:hypothetical protein